MPDTAPRVLQQSVARQIISDLVSEHALEKITENLADHCYAPLADADIDMSGPAAMNQALAEIREEIAAMTVSCAWDDEPAAAAVCGFELEDGTVAYYGVGGDR